MSSKGVEFQAEKPKHPPESTLEHTNGKTTDPDARHNPRVQPMAQSNSTDQDASSNPGVQPTDIQQWQQEQQLGPLTQLLAPPPPSKMFHLRCVCVCARLSA